MIWDYQKDKYVHWLAEDIGDNQVENNKDSNFNYLINTAENF